MRSSIALRRLCPARIDPINTAYNALSTLIGLIGPDPLHQTAFLLLDRERRAVFTLMGEATDDPNSVLGVVDSITDIACDDNTVCAAVIASIRPGGGALYSDIARWADIDEQCNHAGIQLIEWFVLGSSTVSCPRELSGEPPRWVS
jgi:hypothetical protein